MFGFGGSAALSGTAFEPTTTTTKVSSSVRKRRVHGWRGSHLRSPYSFAACRVTMGT